jgi:hypothetical protein
LIRLRTHFASGDGRASSRLRVPVALVCVALLVLLAFVQVTHLHSNQTDADQCPLCVVMHSAAPVTVAAAVVVLVPLGTPAQRTVPCSDAQRPESSLFIRPPPAAC